MFAKLAKRILYPTCYSSQALVTHLRKNGAEIGEDVFFYSPINAVVTTRDAMFLKIGSHVQFTTGIKLLAHDYSFSVLGNAYQSLPRKQRYTKIGNNVFFGMDCVVLMGADIGDNVIVGAGSVVSGKVESNSVYAGNPAKKLCTLDEHFNSNKKHFIESAQCYAEAFQKKNKRLPRIDEMLIYQALFCNREQLAEYAVNEHFRGIDMDCRKNISMPEFENKFSSVEELMAYRND